MRAVAVCVAALIAPALAACDEAPRDTTDAILLYPSDAGPDAISAPDADITMCSTELTCPAALPGKVSICGRLRDVESNAVLEAPGALGERCDPGTPAADGPCSVRLAAYNALDFAGNPTGTPPLPTVVNQLDTCGRFILGNVNRPQIGGYLGIGIHDVSGTDDRLLSGAAFATTSGETRTGTDVWSLRASTDAAWQDSAGLAGESFHERGAVLMLFRYDGVPVDGVVGTLSGSLAADQDFYFSDAAVATRLTIDAARTATGTNGAVVMIGSILEDHGGSGSEPDGCHWTEALAISIRGVLLVTTRELVDQFNSPCPTGGTNTTVTE